MEVLPIDDCRTEFPSKSPPIDELTAEKPTNGPASGANSAAAGAPLGGGAVGVACGSSGITPHPASGSANRPPVSAIRTAQNRSRKCATASPGSTTGGGHHTPTSPNAQANAASRGRKQRSAPAQARVQIQ